MEGITFQYPSWYLIFCVFLGLGYALALYYRDKTFREQSQTLSWFFGALRMLTVTALSILLLSPLLKSLLTETKKPIVVIAQDHSESVISGMDEAKIADYQQKMQSLSAALKEDYDLKEYAFGARVREGVDYQFEDKVSNISELLSGLYDRYNHQNMGAIVLATDGIYNEGSNPVYAGTKLAVPIYTVALGDTTPKRDVLIKRVFHNKIAYLGDKFSVQIDIAAQNCSGANATLNISKIENGKTNRLQQVPLTINKNDFFTTQEVILDANQSGVQRYRISVSQVQDEVTTVNNVKDIFIDVLDARQKILILANSPHPDISAIKQSISTNKNYQVTVAYAKDLRANVAEFDFVVLHQLPSIANPASNIMKTINSKNIPRLYIVGTQTDLRKFNSSQPLLSILGDGRNTNDVQGTIAASFSLFNLDDQLKLDLPKFAPLIAPFGEFKEAKGQVLLYQRIGKVDTKYPLLMLGESENTKMGVLAAEGIWKWRLFDFLQNQNHEQFDELLGKTIQYLSLKEDKRRFRISLDKNIFNENETIVFDAELYNESYELINEPDASLVVTDDVGKDYNFTFNKTTNAYTLNAGSLLVGSYKFKGTVFNNGQNLTYSGQFSVQPIQLEVYEMTADHGLLRLLSGKYGGELVYPSNVNAIAEKIKATGKVKPVIYQTSKTRSVINLKWIFFLLMGLLTVEWFLRRYFGGY